MIRHLFIAMLLGAAAPAWAQAPETPKLRVITIPIAVITLLVFSLILFFASLIANLLVDQQAETIAILRSRGASISQVFGSLLIQSVALGVIALGHRQILS